MITPVRVSVILGGCRTEAPNPTAENRRRINLSNDPVVMRKIFGILTLLWFVFIFYAELLSIFLCSSRKEPSQGGTVFSKNHNLYTARMRHQRNDELQEYDVSSCCRVTLNVFWLPSLYANDVESIYTKLFKFLRTKWQEVWNLSYHSGRQRLVHCLEPSARIYSDVGALGRLLSGFLTF